MPTPIPAPVAALAPKHAVHFVRFANMHDEHYRNAVRVFGLPDFLHRLWDERARREIAEGDVIIFAKGDADQPVSPFNGSDEAYAGATIAAERLAQREGV